MTTPAANHIHTNTMDLIAPLRMAQRRFHEWLAAADQDEYEVADRMLGILVQPELGGLNMRSMNAGAAYEQFIDDVSAMLTHFEALLGDIADEDGWMPTVTLTAKEIGVLSPCLLEAVATAYREGFTNRPGSVIATMAALYNEINSGRNGGDKVLLVFGTCPACWPASIERNKGPWSQRDRLIRDTLDGRTNRTYI